MLEHSHCEVICDAYVQDGSAFVGENVDPEFAGARWWEVHSLQGAYLEGRGILRLRFAHFPACASLRMTGVWGGPRNPWWIVAALPHCPVNTLSSFKNPSLITVSRKLSF